MTGSSRILIEEGSAGAFVVTVLGLPDLRPAHFRNRDQHKGFSGAAGYAVTLAIQLGLQIEDNTGWLTAEQWVELVVETRAGRLAANDLTT